ncbi:MAG: RHS repeat-associated core domain-containing protein, partial [Formivibrio sp.]|nr:RHS repeat-associated core domain-containing protein [Formivibrio sp.]
DLSGTVGGAGGIGGLLARTDNNGSAYYHTDGNGNVTMLVDGSGKMVAQYLYDSFGNTLGIWGPLGTVNTYRFSSKEVDLRTGQYYYGYRYYEPNLQRWLNQDPIGEAGGINLYRMVGNNPINYVDPLGLLDYYSSPGSFLQPSGPVPYLEGDSWYGQLGSAIYNTIPLAANALEKINPFADVGTREGAASGNGDNRGMAMAGIIDAAGMLPGGKVATTCIKAVVRTEARNLAEQMAMREAEAGAGTRIMQGGINDPAFPENVWAKMQHVHGDTTIHYWLNLLTGERTGFKFKD